MPGGFAESSVRLNKFVREQPVWTEEQIRIRTDELARRALDVWPALSVPQSHIDAAKAAEMREWASRRDVGTVRMSEEARALFNELRTQVRGLGPNVLEVAETNSVSYHGPDFFLEVLPRRRRLTLLLPLDFNEIDDPMGLAQDATQWKFFVHARYEGGVLVRIGDLDAIVSAMPFVRQAYTQAVE
jgi:predicted transport protein